MAYRSGHIERRLRALAAGLGVLTLAACATVPREAAEAPAAREQVQILALNDFHGNLEVPAVYVVVPAGPSRLP